MAQLEESKMRNLEMGEKVIHKGLNWKGGVSWVMEGRKVEMG